MHTNNDVNKSQKLYAELKKSGEVIHATWLHLYEMLNQVKLIYIDKNLKMVA